MELVELTEWEQLENLNKEIYLLSDGEFYIYEELALYMNDAMDNKHWRGETKNAYWFESIYYVAVDEDGEEIGLTGIIYTQKTKKSKPVAILGWFLLKQELRGTGKGSELLRLTEQKIIQDGYAKEIWIAADSWIPDGKGDWMLDEKGGVSKFYEKNGYTLLGKVSEIDPKLYEDSAYNASVSTNEDDIVCVKRL